MRVQCSRVVGLDDAVMTADHRVLLIVKSMSFVVALQPQATQVAALKATSTPIPALETACEELQSALDGALQADGSVSLTACPAPQQRDRHQQQQQTRQQWTGATNLKLRTSSPLPQKQEVQQPLAEQLPQAAAALVSPVNNKLSGAVNLSAPTPAPAAPPVITEAAAAGAPAAGLPPSGNGQLQEAVQTLRVKLEALERDLKFERERTEALQRTAAEVAQMVVKSAALSPRRGRGGQAGAGGCEVVTPLPPSTPLKGLQEQPGAPGGWQPSIHIHNSVDSRAAEGFAGQQQQQPGEAAGKVRIVLDEDGIRSEERLLAGSCLSRHITDVVAGYELAR